MHNTRCTIAAGDMEQGLQPLGPMSWLRGLKFSLHALWFSLSTGSPTPTGLIVLLCIETTGAASLLL